MSAHRADHVIAIAQGKGGVGKTTTAMNLAAAAAALGQRVLCVDLDPRYSLTRWLLPDDAGPGARSPSCCAATSTPPARRERALWRASR